MLVNQGFIKKYSIKKYFVEEKFNSKKNAVYKVRCVQENGNEKMVVVKTYYNLQNNKQKELDMLLRLKEKELTVPRVYYTGKNNFIMAYIAGSNLLDVICQREKSAKNKNNYFYQSNRQLISDFFSWLNNFYKLAKEITGKNIIFEDINLRNFIILNDKIYGVDFEDYCEGERERDAGRFCAFVLTYNPIFTDWKTSFIQETLKILKEKFAYKEPIIKQEMEKELVAIKKRRST